MRGTEGASLRDIFAACSRTQTAATATAAEARVAGARADYGAERRAAGLEPRQALTGVGERDVVVVDRGARTAAAADVDRWHDSFSQPAPRR